MPFPQYGSTTSTNVPDVNGILVLLNGGGVPQISAGTIGSIPAAGNVGNIYISTDTNVIFRDNGTSWVNISGSYSRIISTVSTNTSMGASASTDYVYLVSGTTAVTLPTAVGNTNRYTVKNISGITTINTTASQTIDGSASAVLQVVNTSLDFISDGANWRVV